MCYEEKQEQRLSPEQKHVFKIPLLQVRKYHYFFRILTDKNIVGFWLI